MKYILFAISAVFLLGGCITTINEPGPAAPAAQTQQPQIVDQEFDSLAAPQYDYETDISYAEQLTNPKAAAAQPTGTKPSKKPAATKK